MSAVLVKRICGAWVIASLIFVLASVIVVSLVGKVWFFVVLNLLNAFLLLCAYTYRDSLQSFIHKVENDYRSFKKVGDSNFERHSPKERMSCALGIALALVIAALCVYAMVDPQFYYSLIREDGIIENLSALLWAGAALATLFSMLQLVSKRKANKIYMVCATLLFFFFIVCSGEEISWGQRIFNVETLSVLQGINVQGENNLHNIGCISVFSNVFFLIAMCFFILVPFFLNKNISIKHYIENKWLFFPSKFSSIVFVIGLAVWFIAGVRFGTLGFHPYSFFAEHFYSQMDDEIFEFFSAYSFFVYSFSVSISLKYYIGLDNSK